MTGAIAYCFKACETSSSPALLNKVDQLGLLTKIFFIYSFGEAATLLFLICFLILTTGGLVSVSLRFCLMILF